MSRCEKKLKDKFDDEIKRARLESLVPEELEKHLTLSNFRGCAPWKRNLVQGSAIPSRVTRDRLDTLIPWMLMRSTLSLSLVWQRKRAIEST